MAPAPAHGEAQPCGATLFRSLSSNESSEPWVLVGRSGSDVMETDDGMPASAGPFISQLSEDDLRAVEAALPLSQLAPGPPQLFRENCMPPMGPPVGHADHEAHTMAEYLEDETLHVLPQPLLPGPPQLFRENCMPPIDAHMDLPAASSSPATEPQPSVPSPQASGPHSLLVTASCRVASKPLQKAQLEVEQLAKKAHTTVHELPTLAEVRAALPGAKTWWYAGLTDSDGMLVFAGHGGEPQPASVDEVVGMVREAAKEQLRFVVLNAANTLALGEALAEQARVQAVVCWQTTAHDGASGIFARAFWEAVAAGQQLVPAFEAAKAAVTKENFVLEDPEQHRLTVRSLPRAPVAAGIPRLLHPPAGLDDARVKQYLAEEASSSGHADTASMSTFTTTEDAASEAGSSRTGLSQALTRLDFAGSEADDASMTEDEACYRSCGAAADYRSLGAVADDEDETPVYRSLATFAHDAGGVGHGDAAPL